MLEIADETLYALHIAREKALTDNENRAYLASPHSDGMKGMVRGVREEFIQTVNLVYACDQTHDGQGGTLPLPAPRHLHIIFTDQPGKYLG